MKEKKTLKEAIIDTSYPRSVGFSEECDSPRLSIMLNICPNIKGLSLLALSS